jgi:hypothetical protein
MPVQRDAEFPSSATRSQHFARFRATEFLQSEETTDPVLEMNYQLVFVEITEVDLGAMDAELRGALQPPPAMSRSAAKQFRRRQHDQIGDRKTKATRERAFDQVDFA